MRTNYMEPQPEGIKIESASFRVLRGKEKFVCSHKQLEISKSPNHAMEYLSRSWSPSASDFLQMFSSNSLLLHRELNNEDDESLETSGETSKDTVKKHISEMFSHPKTCLRVNSWSSFFRSRREKKKEETRLRTAQLHAALSLTQLAAAITGISHSIPTPDPPYSNGRTGEWKQDMSNVMSSAAALVTTVCAEAAESLGAQRAQIRAAVDSGMAIQTPIDMIAVTATAATCLRGAAILKSRGFADPLARIQEMLSIGSHMCIIMPSGRKECTKVSFYLKQNHLMLSFSKKYLGGALKSSKEFEVSNLKQEKLDESGHAALCLKTRNGIIKLLFKDEMQSKICISTIYNLLEMCSTSWQGSPTNYCFRSFNCM